MISMVSLFECITRSSSLSKEEIKLFAIVNRIFHLSDFLRLVIMSFKYGLILLRYSLTDNVLFSSLLLSYSFFFFFLIFCRVVYSKLLLRKLLWKLSSSFLCSERFSISLSILFLIAYGFFSCLKRFLTFLTAV